MSKGISSTQSKNTAAGQTKGLSVKQTTQFKAKTQPATAAATTKKNVSKVRANKSENSLIIVGEIGTGSFSSGQILNRVQIGLTMKKKTSATSDATRT